jgi:hypothetical protein
LLFPIFGKEDCSIVVEICFNDMDPMFDWVVDIEKSIVEDASCCLDGDDEEEQVVGEVAPGQPL